MSLEKPENTLPVVDGNTLIPTSQPTKNLINKNLTQEPFPIVDEVSLPNFNLDFFKQSLNQESDLYKFLNRQNIDRFNLSKYLLANQDDVFYIELVAHVFELPLENLKVLKSNTMQVNSPEFNHLLYSTINNIPRIQFQDQVKSAQEFFINGCDDTNNYQNRTWARYIQEKWNFHCAVTGLPNVGLFVKNESIQLQAHHLFPTKYFKDLKALPVNGILLIKEIHDGLHQYSPNKPIGIQTLISYLERSITIKNTKVNLEPERVYKLIDWLKQLELFFFNHPTHGPYIKMVLENYSSGDKSTEENN